MHFSKYYAQLLLSLPPELRENAISYRQLNKLINQVVQELIFLGFTPETVQDLVKQGNDTFHAMREIPNLDEGSALVVQSHATTKPGLKLRYEVSNDLGHLVPRLRLVVEDDIDVATTPYIPILTSMKNYPADSSASEYIIPLASDTAFFDFLTSAMNSLSTQLTTEYSEFMAELEDLSKSISSSALPVSQVDAAYKPFSIDEDPGTISIPSTKTAFRPKLDARSDLYLWRQLLGLYVDAEIFDSVSERNHGERSVEDAEVRMAKFLERIEKDGILRGKSKKAYLGVGRFLRLNKIILDLKKLDYASSEATRKILKKHAKRTALPFPPSLQREIISAVGVVGGETPTNTSLPPTGQISQALVPLPRYCQSLSQLLVQAIGETVIPIIPHVDDYSCIICTSIAFKPIRLSCGHLFCIRCLVKMQKQGEPNCPMCRSPCVLTANRTNVDWALMNFMADWFPVESREKMRSNEQEANAELARELGFDGNACLIT